MATVAAPAPDAERERARPEWLENIGGQLLALVAALVVLVHLMIGAYLISWVSSISFRPGTPAVW